VFSLLQVHRSGNAKNCAWGHAEANRTEAAAFIRQMMQTHPSIGSVLSDFAALDRPPLRLAHDAFFVAASRKDAAVIRPVLSEGRAAGRRFVGLGAALDPCACEAAIRGAAGVVAFCSPATFRSARVRQQIVLAAWLQKPLLPVLLTAEPAPAALERTLRAHRCVRLAGNPDWRAEFREALDALACGRSRRN